MLSTCCTMQACSTGSAGQQDPFQQQLAANSAAAGQAERGLNPLEERLC